MAKNNSNLHRAKREKNDEFKTRLEDIEAECQRHIYTISHIVNGYKDNEESGVIAFD